jgi:hypothetical protein
MRFLCLQLYSLEFAGVLEGSSTALLQAQQFLVLRAPAQYLCVSKAFHTDANSLPGYASFLPVRDGIG